MTFSNAADFYKTGGTLPPDWPSYVERDADEELYQAVLAGDFCYVFAARQTGKSSLMAKTRDRLDKTGIRTAVVDLSDAGTEKGKTTDDQWYAGVCESVHSGLGLRAPLESWWTGAKKLVSPTKRFSDFLREIVLPETDGRVIIFVDEVDFVFSLPFADDFFAAIRAAHNARAVFAEYERLTFVLLGVAAPSQLIRDPTRTPFNIGRGIELTDFSRNESSVLQPMLGERSAELMDEIMRWTEGHPYLTQVLCRLVASENTRSEAGDPALLVERCVRTSFLSAGAQRTESNLKLVSDRLTRGSPEQSRLLLRLYHRVARGEDVADEPADQISLLLKLSGVVRSDEHGRLRVRNRIYQEVFTTDWARAHFPTVENRPSLVFLSHSGEDGKVVAAIRDTLAACGVSVWDDARPLSAGAELEPAILQALNESRAYIAILSHRAIDSKWVSAEIRHALELQRQRGPSYKVIPVTIDGLEPSGLAHWFPAGSFEHALEIDPGSIPQVPAELLDELGLTLPVDAGLVTRVEPLPVAELRLELFDPSIDRSDGKYRATATAQLEYTAPKETPRVIRSKRFRVVAPLGPIEADELSWYLERYVNWPSGVFQQRARAIENRLPEWGRALHAAAFGHEFARQPYEAWKSSGRGVVRRLSILVDRDLMAADPERQVDADEAASLLLNVPWELLHDDDGYLFVGLSPMTLRRALPNRKAKPVLPTAAPLRVLLVSPRPEDERAPYIDHRVSVRPVVEALASLGELANLKLLTPPTFAAFANELTEAQRRGEPYHVVHFDGQGVYSQRTGLGALCFESAEDSGKSERRRSDVVDALTLAEVMRDQRVPLFFLDAGQSTLADKDPTASVAGTLLQEGVASVIAMSHSVLIETTRRFATVFYRELLAGRRIGEAMAEGQRELLANTFRYRTFQGELHLQDWFVPVLYQEEDDPQLIREVPGHRVQEVLARQRRINVGDLPAPPIHGFVGRSRELLKSERLLEAQPYVVLRGEGGEGKTTLAAELARWLVETRRYERAAFASLETHAEARSLLFAIGSQLVVNYASFVGQDDRREWLEVERALRDHPTVIVLDNLDSALPPEFGTADANLFEPEVLQRVLNLAKRLASVGETRIVFTSRQVMPDPFAENHISISRLARREAFDLVARALGREKEAPPADDPGESEDEVTRLVDAVGCHARSLVILAREVAQSGVRHATERLGELMARLHESYADDRERSLFATVELTLKRLPKEVREAIRPLGVFRGGGHLLTIAQVIGLDVDEPKYIHAIANSLVSVGLAELMEYGYLRFDPALQPLLWSEMSDTERTAASERWARATQQLIEALYQQQFGDDPKMASRLTVLDLRNVLGTLDHIAATASAETVVNVATKVESLLQNLGRPKALAHASAAREAATKGLSNWSHAQFIAHNAAVERLLEAGRFREATAGARTIVEQMRSLDEKPHDPAPYDFAVALWNLGQALQLGGDPATALMHLRDAYDRFQQLANGGSREAAGASSLAMAGIAECFRDLGRLDEAANAYEEAIGRAQEMGDARQIAAHKGQMGTVRLLQRRFAEAAAAFEEARETFEELGEVRSLAAVCHQLGVVHQQTRNYSAAEQAYQESLRIEIQSGHRAGEAHTLGQLGNLYRMMGRLQDAGRFYEEASAIYQDLDDPASEARTRYNLAFALLRQNRYDDARLQVMQAIERESSFGYAADPWECFDLLAKIERAAGNVAAGDAARQQAIDAYLAYRRDGGRSLSGQIVSFVAQAIADDRISVAESKFLELEKADQAAYLKPLLPKLQAILRGSRDPSLAEDLALEYGDAVELKLLLEHLAREAE